MKIIKLPLTKLKRPEKNVRIHTEQQIDEFVRSIRMFGQIRPVVVDEDNVILAGNGLVIALEKAGIKEADVYKIEDLSENQKKKLMIADNKIFNLGIENLDTLNDFLADLGNDLDVPGFDEDILRTMVADAEDVTEKICNYGTLNNSQIESIRSSSGRNNESDSPSEPPEPEDMDETKSEDSNKPQGDYVVCPKCGERIWL